MLDNRLWATWGCRLAAQPQHCDPACETCRRLAQNDKTDTSQFKQERKGVTAVMALTQRPKNQDPWEGLEICVQSLTYLKYPTTDDVFSSCLREFPQSGSRLGWVCVRLCGVNVTNTCWLSGPGSRRPGIPGGPLHSQDNCCCLVGEEEVPKRTNGTK